MAKNTDEKLNILEAVKAFAKDDISKAGINLFSTLGYDTSLQAPLDDKAIRLNLMTLKRLLLKTGNQLIFFSS